LIKKKTNNKNSISQSNYTREYFDSCCQGHREYAVSQGKILPIRLEIPLKIANIQPGMRILDIGCGRGEIVINSAFRGAWVCGMDYAKEAVKLSMETITRTDFLDIRKRIVIHQANACSLPFRNNSFDVVFMLDIIEHLNPVELNTSLDEVWRVLVPNGLLVVHTMPNLWYYHFGYPIYRLIQRLRGQHLPTDPRDRWPYSHVHINEQTAPKLKNTLRISQFKPKVWLMPTHSYEDEQNILVRYMMNFITRFPPLNWIFCNDIFGIGVK
jgi:ubiquinone/menaquinone biosynthesis C-methylase UbiE